MECPIRLRKCARPYVVDPSVLKIWLATGGRSRFTVNQAAVVREGLEVLPVQVAMKVRNISVSSASCTQATLLGAKSESLVRAAIQVHPATAQGVQSDR